MRIIRKAIRICVFLSVFLLSLGLTRISVHAAHSSDDAFAVLAGKTAGVLTGTPQDTIVKSKVENVTIQYFNNASDLQLALQSDKIDFFILATTNYYAMADQYPEFAYIDHPLTTFNIGTIFPMTEAGNSLRQEFNQYLAELQQSGRLQELRNFWIVDQDKEAIDIPLTGENGILHMATLNTQIPFSYMYNGQNVGYDIALAAGFCREYGYGLEIENVEFTGAISGIAAGKYDLAAGQIAWTQERAQSIYYSDFYAVQEIVPIVRASDFSQVELTSKNQQNSSAQIGIAASIRRTLIDENRWQQILRGLAVTLIITLAGFALANLLGGLFCALSMSDSSVLRFFAAVYSGLMQGLPMVVILMILYYVVFGHSRINNAAVAIIGFGCIFGSHMAQLFESSIRSVEKGQWEAALAIGFTKRETFCGIVLPQAVRVMLKGYCSSLISLMKATAIVGYIAVTDLTRAGDIIRSNTYEAVIPLVTIAIIYLLAAAGIIFIMHRISRRLR